MFQIQYVLVIIFRSTLAYDYHQRTVEEDDAVDYGQVGSEFLMIVKLSILSQFKFCIHLFCCYV